MRVKAAGILVKLNIKKGGCNQYIQVIYTRVAFSWYWTVWRSGLHVWIVMRRSWVLAPSKNPIVSLSKKLYPYCLLLVGSKNGFECDFTIELKWIEGLMEDWLKCQISPLVKWCLNKNKTYLISIIIWNSLLYFRSTVVNEVVAIIVLHIWTHKTADVQDYINSYM